MTTNNAINNVDMPLAGGTFTGTVAYSAAAENWAKGSDVASGSTTNIGAATGNYVHVTGTTTITAFDTVQAGTIRYVKFTGILILTYNATSLILPNNASNITTAAGDTAEFVSEGSGNWICTNYQRANGQALQGGTAGSGGLKSFQILTSGTAATYTKPGGITSILVECVGGGGGGGGVSQVASGGASGGGGGAGGYARKYYSAAAGTYTYTVGASANGGVAGNNNGTAGNNTTFDVITCNGGGAGIGMAAVALTGPGGAGGAGGTATGGDINVKGQAGGIGFELGGVAGLAVSGAGGNTIYGAGGTAVAVASGALAGISAAANSGGGGGGAVNFNTSAQAGGNGGSGLIIVWEFA